MCAPVTRLASPFVRRVDRCPEAVLLRCCVRGLLRCNALRWMGRDGLCWDCRDGLSFHVVHVVVRQVHRELPERVCSVGVLVGRIPRHSVLRMRKKEDPSPPTAARGSTQEALDQWAQFPVHMWMG